MIALNERLPDSYKLLPPAGHHPAPTVASVAVMAGGSGFVSGICRNPER
jgi:hypothetical protein